MNWDDPAARGQLIDRVGPDEYNRLHTEQMKKETVEIVNGYGIRLIHSARFGPIYVVDGTGKGHSTLQGARKIAWDSPTGQVKP